MSITPDIVEKQALSLPREDRARLVVHLIDSMEKRTDLHTSTNVEHMWLAEADSRYKAYLRGDDHAIPAEQVFSELRKEDI